MYIKIVDEFTDLPGGRYITQGPYSAELFREGILRVKYDLSVINEEKLIVDFDGGYGYGSGFLEESFGGMVRAGYDGNDLLNNMIFISKEDKDLPNKVHLYITEAIKNKNKILK